MKQFQHWKQEVDQKNILWLAFDRADRPINALSHDALNELQQILTDTEKNKSLRGLVIYSAKDSGFIAGADIEQFSGFHDLDAAKTFMEEGQQVFLQLANIHIPTVAMIAGYCLGGGLELAIACDYRVVQDDHKTRLGAPEVKLGIHPAWGGTVRTLKLMGPLAGLNLILGGHTISGKAAAKLGLVDIAVPERQLRHAAQYFIEQQPPLRKNTFLQRFLNSYFPRLLLAKYLHSVVSKKAKPEHYPAPFAMIDLWKRYGAEGKAAYAAEIDSVIRILQQNDTPKNLIRIFSLQEKLKGLAKGINFNAQHVHVIGAGVMGGDIAAWCALQGLTVTLQDREPSYVSSAIARAYRLFKDKLKNPRDIQAAMDRLIPDIKGQGVAKADVIIEAIFEDLAVKQALFKELEAQAKPDAILATNTSSIPLDEINQVLKDKSRLVGIHFFNPVAKMLLVEVVKGNETGETVSQNAIAFVRQIDRLPLPVRSKPGFLVNRVLMPYLLEAMILLEEGVSAPTIDQIARDFGMPMGPIELSDKVGLDVCLSVAKNLTQHFGGRVPERLATMVAKGELGMKSGKGFYRYQRGKLVKRNCARPSEYESELGNRLIMRLINESAACLREEVVMDIDLLDAGMVFGTGFAPFRGGPMQYARYLGQEHLLKIFGALEKQYGLRFKPDTELKAIVS